MSKQYKCAICKKTITSGIGIAPDPNIPEIKKTMYFCGSRCQNVFIGSIKRSRTKKKKKEWREELEQREDQCETNGDYIRLFETLTSDEKEFLTLVGLGTFMAQKTLKEFYALLKERVSAFKGRKNGA